MYGLNGGYGCLGTGQCRVEGACMKRCFCTIIVLLLSGSNTSVVLCNSVCVCVSWGSMYYFYSCFVGIAANNTNSAVNIHH